MNGDCARVGGQLGACRPARVVDVIEESQRFVKAAVPSQDVGELDQHPRLGFGAGATPNHGMPIGTRFREDELLKLGSQVDEGTAHRRSRAGLILRQRLEATRTPGPAQALPVLGHLEPAERRNADDNQEDERAECKGDGDSVSSSRLLEFV